MIEKQCVFVIFLLELNVYSQLSFVMAGFKARLLVLLIFGLYVSWIIMIADLIEFARLVVEIIELV